MTAIRATADVIAGVLGTVGTYCGEAVCGTSVSAGGRTRTVYAGRIPVLADDIVLALTEDPGAPAEDRQTYRTGYDDPEYTLHILSDDLVAADTLAQTIRSELDRTGHHVTDDGTINTLAVAPPRRTVRPMRPRYDLQVSVRAEYVRRDAWDTLVLGGITFTQTGSTASLTSAQYFAGMGFETADIDITES